MRSAKFIPQQSRFQGELEGGTNRFFLWLLKPMSSEGEGGLKQHSTHAAHMKHVTARAPRAHVAGGGGVGPTTRLSLSQQPDEALLPPELAPTVPHNPEVCAILRAVTHQLDAVVELDVGIIVTASEDSSVVVLKVAGSHRDGEGTNVSYVVHDSVLVIDREVVVASDGGDRAEAGQVVLTAAGVHGGARGVGVVRLRDRPEQLDVAVAKGRGGPAAPAISPAAQGVGGAGGHLLGAPWWCP